VVDVTLKASTPGDPIPPDDGSFAVAIAEEVSFED
jgi:hypothetical protein